ncbi:GNAT family N-acetyltransferase [Umezawaea sp. Da 62-37]|uniref:GNAT family N-acetyltransferase n=1 Tax=Umezawaea sp. Da 62-37 TaxID=3075927 RepID=UPI0028F7023F|nr:GNAT family N-acetyltransferase [Umezawaea sp. Da 62-37]WNV86830.1 GNAT family N-acetyltransferase [Umezawaea sp. Da 62-37]
MIVRPAVAADLDAFVASAAALFAEDGGVRDPRVDVSWPLRHGHEYYGAAIAADNVLCLLAVHDDRVVGHLLGRLKGPNEVRPAVVGAELESIRVAEDARGTGVGAALDGAFRTWALDRGVNEITVHAYAANTAALAYYRARGYQQQSVVLRLPLER